MVGVLIQIKLATLRHSMTGSRAAVTIIGGVSGLLLAVGTLLLSITASEPATGSVNVLCLVFLLWTLGWVLGPLLTGGESTLQPEYFRLLPISSRRLAIGLLGATFVGIAPLMSLFAFSGIVLYAAHLGVFPTLVAIVAVPLQLVSVILLSRVISRGVGQATQSRLGMELGAFLIGFCIAFFNVGWWALPAMIQAASSQSPGFSTLLRLLPSGWPMVAVDAASHSHWMLAVAPLFGLAALCGLLLSVWAWLLSSSRTPTSSHKARVDSHTNSWVLLATPLGAVMGKELRTWWRDPVRGRFLRMGMWMAVFFGLLPALAGASSVLPWIGPLAVLFMTAFAGNMYGFDGSALWLVLTTPGAARADVRGRQVAWLLLVAPLTIALTLSLTFVSGQSWGWLLAATLLPALLGSGAGVIVFFSVLKMVPVTDPHRRGRSIMVAGSDIDAGELQVEGFLSLALMLVLAVPASAVTLIGVSTHRLDLQWIGMALGMMTGLAVYWWFGRLAYTKVETHGPELLTLMAKGSVSRSSPSETSQTK